MGSAKLSNAFLIYCGIYADWSVDENSRDTKRYKARYADLIDRDKNINDTKCLLCGHYLSTHLVIPYGINCKTTSYEIVCQEASRENYSDTCNCHAGFKEVQINITVGVETE